MKLASVVKSFAISGIDAYVVNIESDTIFGQPSVTIVGLGDAAVKEARQRLGASGMQSLPQAPPGKIFGKLIFSEIKYINYNKSLLN